MFASFVSTNEKYIFIARKTLFAVFLLYFGIGAKIV